MEQEREKSNCGKPMEVSDKGLGLASETQTLAGEDANVVEVSDSGVCDVSESVENVKVGDENTGDSVSEEKQVKGDVASVEDVVEADDDVEESGAVETEETAKNGASDETAGEDKSLTSDGNEGTDEKAECEVEDNGGACDAQQDVKSKESSVDGVTVSVEEEEADRGKESADKSEAVDSKMDDDSKDENVGSETKDAKHSEPAQVPEVSTELSKKDTDEEHQGTVSEVGSAGEIRREEETTDVNQEEENGEAMEIDNAAEEQVEKDVTVGGVLDNAGNESAGASAVHTEVPIDEADTNGSNEAKEMDIDERKDNANVATDLTGTIESADSGNPNNLAEDAAPGEVEPLDHNALFDPGSDITNFIDFTGVSSWSGNIQDLKTDTGNVSLKQDKKDTDMAEEEVPTVDCGETPKSVDATINAESRDKQSISAEGIENESNATRVATDSPKEASDAILGSEENQEDQKTVDQEDTMREEDETAHEAPSIDPNQKEDTEMEENRNHSDYADDGTDSDIKTNGLKRKADVLSEDSAGEGRKTVSLAKVSFAERPSFKIGACIARAASQMSGTPSVLKGSNVSDETLSVESFVSQLHSAATDPVKENVVSEIAAGFFLDFRNSSATQDVTPENISRKRGRPSNSNAGGTEAFEFEEMGDTYWTDRVIRNGGEEQTPPTEKGNYQVVPVELKPAPVQRTRRPYRRRQSQISLPLPSAADKQPNFDENAPAELIMNFSETDTIPPEKSLCKMFRHFGPIRESQTEVDAEKNRARVVFRKGADAKVAYNSAGRFNIFGTKTVNYELSSTITETFKVQPYVVSLTEEEAALCLPS